MSLFSSRTYLNGKPNHSGADAGTSTPVNAVQLAEPATVPARTNGISLETARFMPVMDIEQAMQRREVIVQAMQKLMHEGVDYGKIPGAEKPTLLEPGADKL